MAEQVVARNVQAAVSLGNTAVSARRMDLGGYGEMLAARIDFAGGVHGLPIGVDTMVPAQFFSPRHRRTPEQSLCLAVLEDALHVLRVYPHDGDKARRIREDAAAWIASDAIGHPFDFRNVCDVLDLDAVSLRKKLALPVRPRPPSPTRLQEPRRGFRGRVLDAFGYGETLSGPVVIARVYGEESVCAQARDDVYSALWKLTRAGVLSRERVDGVARWRLREGRRAVG